MYGKGAKEVGALEVFELLEGTDEIDMEIKGLQGG